MYVVMILVDGQRVACNKQATMSDVEFLSELRGPEWLSFRYELEDNGKAVDVRNDGLGTVVTIAHEEI